MCIVISEITSSYNVITECNLLYSSPNVDFIIKMFV